MADLPPGFTDITDEVDAMLNDPELGPEIAAVVRQMHEAANPVDGLVAVAWVQDDSWIRWAHFCNLNLVRRNVPRDTWRFIERELRPAVTCVHCGRHGFAIRIPNPVVLHPHQPDMAPPLARLIEALRDEATKA